MEIELEEKEKAKKRRRNRIKRHGNLKLNVNFLIYMHVYKKIHKTDQYADKKWLASGNDLDGISDEHEHDAEVDEDINLENYITFADQVE